MFKKRSESGKENGGRVEKYRRERGRSTQTIFKREELRKEILEEKDSSTFLLVIIIEQKLRVARF